MNQWVDMYYGIPESHNINAYPWPRREARSVINYVGWDGHTVRAEDFIFEYPADARGAVSPAARPRAWRYQFIADGRRVIVRQAHQQPRTITVDGRDLTVPDLSPIPENHRAETRRAGTIATLINHALS
ncbi:MULTISPECIES: hypothetical protein [unclassified Streptomyces]|uniref:hypothetical protein n=1 Tax=unclassified Streptomyces TaxID=2593676 RepID=UPI0033E0593C